MRLATWLSRLRLLSSHFTQRTSRPRRRPDFEHLECRRVLTTLLVSPDGNFDGTPTPFATIQSAVDAAAPGDMILVGPGAYQEQLLITKDSLDLVSSTPGAAVIQAPTNDVLTGNAAIVDIQGSQGVTLDGFTIVGPGPGLPCGLTFGVYVEGSSGTILANNRVTQIFDNPASGTASGIGIEVGLSPDRASALGLAPTAGSGLVVNNTVDSYQANGIVVDNAGSYATIENNTVTGIASDRVVQNGIVVSNGAVAVVQGNTVSSNLLTVSRATESAGILLSNPGAGVQVLDNTVVFNDAGIVLQGAVDPVLSGNTVSWSLFDGIQLLAGTSGAEVANNQSTLNGLDGIYVVADGNTLADNTLTYNAEDGIHVIEVSGNVIQGNTASNNARYGISEFLSGDQSNTVSDDSVQTDGIGALFPGLEW